MEFIRSNQRQRIKELLLSFSAIDLYQSLINYWQILFETVKVKKTGKQLTSFSEFTESHLLATVTLSDTIRSVTLGVFKHLLIDMNVISLETLLKLFMEYLAAHFGQIDAYISAQSILENILEAYFYRLYVVRGYTDSLSSGSDLSLNLKQQSSDVFFANGKLINSNDNNNISDSLCSQMSSGSESDKTTSSLGLYHSDCSMKDSNTDEMRKHRKCSTAFHSEALKFLIRIYLSALKMYSSEMTSMNIANKSIQLKYVKFLRDNFNKIYSNHILLAQNDVNKQCQIDIADNIVEQKIESRRTQNNSIYFDSKNSIKMLQTPILFYSRRPNYLNNMQTIVDGHKFNGIGGIGHCGHNENDTASNSGGEKRKIIDTVLKMQSLLASGILTRDILQEIIHFIEANTPFIGVDSFLTLLMPHDLCIDYLIEMYPECLLEYAKV